MAITPDSRQTLRKELRALRNSLSPSQQAAASAWVLRYLTKLPLFMRAKHIALYIANDGELNPQPIAEQLWKMGKKVYLPVIHPSLERKMSFVEFTPASVLLPNRFGIPEPESNNAHKFPPHLLDVVLLPLVGFDRQGGRLGMGGGFYDTTFAFHQHKKGKPYLIGVAHSCQEIEQLEMADWDIPLYAIATDKEVILTKS